MNAACSPSGEMRTSAKSARALARSVPIGHCSEQVICVGSGTTAAAIAAPSGLKSACMTPSSSGRGAPPEIGARASVPRE